MIMSLKQKKIKFRSRIERFSYEIEMKTREQNRNNQRTEIERFDWLGERGANARMKKLHAFRTF